MMLKNIKTYPDTQNRQQMPNSTGKGACAAMGSSHSQQGRLRSMGYGLFWSAWILLFVSCATANENTARQQFREHPNFYIGASSAREKRTANPEEPVGTLDSYVAYAMKKSPALEAQFERWQASIHRISQMRRLPDPTISYAFYVSSVETRVGPQRHKVSLKQSFPWPTQLSAGADVGSAKAQFAEKRFDALAIAIRAGVADRYWSLWELKEVRKVHQEHVAILAGLSESASAQIMTGKIDLADHQQIELTAARIADLISEVDERSIQASAALKGIIGAPQTMSIHVASKPTGAVHVFDEETLLVSVRNHPYIDSFEALALASEAEAKREEAGRYPNFSLGVDWIETGETDMPNVPDSGKDAVIVGLGISIPLWQRNYKESVEAYKSEMRAHRAEGKAAEDQAVARFYATLSNVRDAKRRIELYEGTLVPQAQSVFESVTGAYASGRSNVAAMLLAQRDLLELRVHLIKARSDYSKSWAALSNIVGREIEAHQREVEWKEENQ